MKVIILLFDGIISIYFIFLSGCFITNYDSIFKKGVSNLSITGMIFVVLLSIRWVINKQSFAKSIFIRFLKCAGKLNDKTLLTIIAVIFTAILFSIGLMRHLAFSTGIDLGVVDQAIWNTMYGGGVLFTSLMGNISYLGVHFSPILLLIAPFFLIGHGTIILIFLQSLAIGMSVFSLYLIAKQRLNNRLLVFVFILAFFLSKPLRGVGLLDFHADVFLIPLVFISYYLLITKRTFWLIVSIVLMLCCKESAAILVFAYGIFITAYLKRRYLGASLIVLGIGWWVVVTNLIMPRLAYTESYPYINWLPFGTTYIANLSAIIKNPLLPIKLFFSSQTIEYFVKLFVPLGLLSFLSPRHYVLFLFPLAFNILGSIHHAGMTTITSHYPAQVLPFIFISAIYGAGKLTKKSASLTGIIIIFLVLAFFGKSDGHKLSKFIHSANTLHSNQIREALKQIPEQASVSAVHRIAPHLSHRKYIYFWENSPDTRYLAEYVVLHRQLIENEVEKFDRFLLQLNEEGFKKIYSDVSSGFYIFHNPLNKQELLEHIQRKIKL